MRENRLYGSEGGEVKKPSLPLSGAAVRASGLLAPRMLWPLDCFVARAPRNDGWVAADPRISRIRLSDRFHREARKSIVKTLQRAVMDLGCQHPLHVHCKEFGGSCARRAGVVSPFRWQTEEPCSVAATRPSD